MAPLRRLVPAGLVTVAAACGPAVAPSPTARPPISSPATSSPSSASPAASASASASAGVTADRPNLSAVRVALAPVTSGLTAPLFITGSGDGSGRRFVVEQPGMIRVLDATGASAAAPFLDIRDRVSGDGGERGLLGLAFPPDFGPGRPWVVVHYSNRKGDTTVSTFAVDPHAADRLDPASERVVLTVPQPYPNHNGGWIGFAADGMLLVALGDGGSGGDPENRASDRGTLLGKILRLDLLGAPEGAPYAVPADNPFLAVDGARPEILHLGLRNPFRASVDAATGNLWIGDVGQGTWEEVDVAARDARGLDFGWRRWEARHCFNPGTGCDAAGVTQPVVEYRHELGCSVIGGPVYRGAAIPELRGAYLFADFCSGRLWAIDAGSADPSGLLLDPVLLAETGRSISALGTDDAGEVYVTDLAAGEVLRLVSATAP